MIGFYLTTTGEYSPEQVADISNSVILDDKNKTFKAMNQYVFEFQKLSADYENLTADSSREGLSIYGAKAMYEDLYGKIPGAAAFERIEASINTLEEWETVVNASVDTINSSISSLETWHDGVNTSIADINSSISAIKTDYIPNASMGVNGGVATLDASGRVPSSQLPSYVDDIIEGYLYNEVFYEDQEHEHAITGEGGKIYVDLTTNTSWRWGGSAYTQVSESLALGETEGTAYEGSKGKALKDAFDLHESSAAIHITAAERAAWNDASDNSHTHSNKSTLDKITDTDVTNWIDASNAKHTHANAGILEGLTDTSISNWNDAASKAHEHTNGDILNGITDSSFHSHNNKSVLDNISSDDITNWNDASNAKHTHSNKDILDGIVDSSFHTHENKGILDGINDASIAAWENGEENVNADWNATSGDASILNRPTLGSAATKDFTTAIESSTGALATDGAILDYAGDAVSKAHEHSNIDILDGIADASFHTHANKNILDGFVDASVTAWNSAADDAHTHDNKELLDSITSTDIANWIDASNAKHSHSNKDILDHIVDSSFHTHNNLDVLEGITTTDVTNWIDASNAKHTHNNAAILNSITDSSFHVHDNKDVLDGITDSSFHTHANLDVLDEITSDDIINWIDASNAKHSHSNKSVIDGITATDVTNWIDASNAKHSHSNSDILNGFTDASIAAFIQDTSYTQGTLVVLTAGTDTTPMVWDASVINAYIAQLDADAVRYRGDIDASTGQIVGSQETLTTIANKIGDVYVVSSEGTLCGVDMQIGDSIIFKKKVNRNVAPEATDLTFVQGTVKVTNEDATLQWGQLTKIATVEGVDISVALPADPTTELVTRVEDISAYAIEVSSYAAEVSTYAANVSTYVANVSTYAADVSSRLDTINTTLTGRIENVSIYAINVSTYASNVSTYAADVSSRLATVNTTLTGRIENVSTYAINVSTNLADASSRLATVNATLTNRIENVSTYAINVSAYAANVSTNLAFEVSTFNEHFADIDASLRHHDSSIIELYESEYELTQVWAAAWYDLSTHFSVTDASLDAHVSDDTIHITSAERTAWNSASTDKHTHSNMSILNGIADASFHTHSNKALLDGIADASFHTHTNKAILDGFVDASVTAWNGAATNSHSHSNMTILNGIADASFHTHTNKSILDGLNDTSVSNWNTAYTNSHTHTNKSILDGLNDTSVGNWNTAYGWGNHANAGYAQQSYASDISTRLGTVDTTLTTRIQNVSTYAINVSTNLATDYQNSLNTAAMLMLASFAGLPTSLNTSNYKYLVSDASSAALFGKRQNDTWYFSDDTDDLMDTILSTYGSNDTMFSNMYRLSIALSLAHQSGTLTETTNPEWKWVILDSQDKVLAGIKQDDTWYMGASIDEIVDCVLDTYAAGGASSGTFANKPTTPSVGKMYFATDKTATGGSVQGVPIWWNGTNWVDAIGNTVS